MGDIAGTLTIIQNGFRMGETLNRFPRPIDYRIHTSFVNGNIRLLERYMNYQQLNEKSLVELENSLKRATSVTMIQHAYQTECLYLLACLQDPSLTGWMMKSDPVKRKVAIGNIAECLDRLDELVDISGLKGYERYQQMQRFKRDIENLSAFHIMTRNYIPFILQYIKKEIRLQARIDSSRIAIAVERYRLETGKLPERLEELIPMYLDEVPIDPYDGQPFRYKRLEKGYTIYSIGTDREDDSGIKRPVDFFTVHR